MQDMCCEKYIVFVIGNSCRVARSMIEIAFRVIKE